MNRQERRNYIKKYNTPNKMENYMAEVEKRIKSEYRNYYEKKYHEDLLNSVDIFIVALTFVLHNSEYTRFGKKRLYGFNKELFATIDMFRTDEYSVNDYIQSLKKDGIEIKNLGGETIDEY